MAAGEAPLIEWLSAWWATLSGVEIVLCVIAACWLAMIACAPAVIGEIPDDDTEIEGLAAGAPASQAEACVLPPALRAQNVQRGAGGPVCTCHGCVAHRALVNRGYAFVAGRFVAIN